MRVFDPVHEEHFSEGEPDLEPPEELALGELDDEAMLEEELDNEDVSEEDVDDEVLTVTLEHISHAEDDADGGVATDATAGPDGYGDLDDTEAMELLEELDVDEIEDLEESLDRLLAQRLAIDGPDLDEAGEHDGGPGTDGAGGDRDAVVGLGDLRGQPGTAAHGATGCSPGEFVCSVCFLVRSRAQLADAALGVCRDCTY